MTGGIRVIFEDNHLLVVEKPVNIPSQGDETGDPDMLALLKEYLKDKYQKPGNVYLGLVHRLDRPVGGVMVFAKTSKAASRLSEQIRTGSFRKAYLAVVHGSFEDTSGSLSNYLLKDSRTNTVRIVKEDVPGAMHALLDYAVEAFSAGFSLVRINLHTGRPHQIRVQMAACGHPLYGDQKYGAGVNKPGQQIALWSTSLSLTHPTQKVEQTFSCMPPDQMPWSLFRSLNRDYMD